MLYFLFLLLFPCFLFYDNLKSLINTFTFTVLNKDFKNNNIIEIVLFRTSGIRRNFFRVNIFPYSFQTPLHPYKSEFSWIYFSFHPSISARMYTPYTPRLARKEFYVEDKKIGWKYFNAHTKLFSYVHIKSIKVFSTKKLTVNKAMLML